MFSLNDVSVQYQDNLALRNFTFDFEPGVLTFIVGPNGSGKSSLLKAMNHLVDYTGTIQLRENNILDFNQKEKALSIGYIAQMNEIMFPYTIYETVLMGRYPHLKSNYSDYQKIDYKKVEEVLKDLDLTSIKEKLITKCSGGELQRVYIARLLVQETDVILVDEITNHLDIKYQIETMELLSSLAHQHNKCVICVIHDLKMAQKTCDTLLVLNQGRLIYAGQPNNFSFEEISQIYDIELNKLLSYIS